jgi:hypothetical protein
MMGFQLLPQRYLSASTLLTSSDGLDEWGMTAALIDQLLHTYHVVPIQATATGFDINVTSGGSKNSNIPPPNGPYQRQPRLVISRSNRKLSPTEKRTHSVVDDRPRLGPCRYV